MLSGVGRQVLVTLCANLLSISYGTSIGWASGGIPFLQSNETALPSGPLTAEDASWIQSVFMIGGFFGSLVYGWVAGYGRKKALISIALPQIAAWILIITARSSTYILISRLCSGFSGGGLYIILPLFTSEIADDRIRGRLGSAYVFSVGIGILFAYTCGTFVAYTALPFIYIPISIAFLIGSAFYPDSVHFFIAKRRNDDAETSLKFYRGVEAQATITSNEQLKIEFESIKSLINVSSGEDGGGKPALSDFLTKPAKRVLLIGVVLMFLEQFGGVFALLFYVSTIFRLSGSTVSPNGSSIIVAVLQLAGAYGSTLLVDRAGRRFLISGSAFGISLGMFVFALHSFLKASGHVSPDLDWIPLVSFSFVLLVANLGVLTLPFLLTSELTITLPLIKSSIYTFCLCLSWVFAFIILKCLDSMIELLGIGGVMLIFSINSLMGGLFVALFVPETRGKSFAEILEELES